MLATTTFDGKHDYWVDGASMPAAWKKVYGKGRVFYTALGHQPEVFDVGVAPPSSAHENSLIASS